MPTRGADASPGVPVGRDDLLVREPRMVGTPETIADRLEEWQDAGIDGLNIIAQHFPGSSRDFVDHVIPVLQERGLAQREYAPGTLRERLFPESGGRLSDRHPAARYRGAFQAEDVLSTSGTSAGWR